MTFSIDSSRQGNAAIRAGNTPLERVTGRARALAKTTGYQNTHLFHLLLAYLQFDAGTKAFRQIGGCEHEAEEAITSTIEIDREIAPERGGHTEKPVEISGLLPEAAAAVLLRERHASLSSNDPWQALLQVLAALSRTCTTTEFGFRRGGLGDVVDRAERPDMASGAEPQGDGVGTDFTAEMLDELTGDFDVVSKNAPPPRGPRAGMTQKTTTKSADDPEKAVLAAIRDLSELAEAGEIEPAYGRDAEIDHIISILLRKRKNSLVLHGEAGVGKTAIAEGVALALRRADVPEALANRPLLEVSLTTMVAGTKFRGDFEAKMDILLRIAKERRAILFIDELHMLMGSGTTTPRSMDGANMLKPALARGDIAIIGATTSFEARSMRSDKALMRRFDMVLVREPSPEHALEILTRAAKPFLDHHEVTEGEGALALCVDIAHHHLPDRRFPDKAFDVLDMAGVVAREAKSTSIEKSHVRDAARRLGARLPGLPGEAWRKRVKALPEALEAFLPNEDGRLLTRTMAAAMLGLGRTGARGAWALAEREAGAAAGCAEAIGRQMDIPVARLDVSLINDRRDLPQLIGYPGQRDALDHHGELVDIADSRDEVILVVEGMEQADRTVRELMAAILRKGTFVAGDGRCLSLGGAWMFFAVPALEEQAEIGFLSRGPESGKDLTRLLGRDIFESLSGVLNATLPEKEETVYDEAALIEMFEGAGIVIRFSEDGRRTLNEMLEEEVGLRPAAALIPATRRVADLVAEAIGGVGTRIVAETSPVDGAFTLRGRAD